jgi:hypothetical protein
VSSHWGGREVAAHTDAPSPQGGKRGATGCGKGRRGVEWRRTPLSCVRSRNQTCCGCRGEVNEAWQGLLCAEDECRGEVEEVGWELGKEGVGGGRRRATCWCELGPKGSPTLQYSSPLKGQRTKGPLRRFFLLYCYLYNHCASLLLPLLLSRN